MGLQGDALVTRRLAAAAVHGRFQPLHNGHLEYILAAKEMCDFLYVGLTQLTIGRLQDVSVAAPHRATRLNNPLTYFERLSLLREALTDAGVSSDSCLVVPFPIEDDGGRYLSEFLPLTVPMLTTVYDDWNREKVALLRGLGYRVEILWERNSKDVVGSTVRESILIGDGRYAEMVPAATARAVEQLDLAARLAQLRQAR